jgi:DnaJ-class molecular chaperone
MIETCKICLGSGTITCLSPEGITSKYYSEACGTCFGQGIVLTPNE